jgi:glycosyltransferase involved in cell wall biosynthesis
VGNQPHDTGGRAPGGLAYSGPEGPPTLSVIVPCFNAGATLARCLASVCSQRGPGVEVIVIDGGSTDQSVEVIRSFAGQIDRWVSEPDRGQSHAINKGYAIASGQIVAWLNADDAYEPGALALARARLASAARVGEARVLAGACRMVYEGVAGADYVWTPREKDIEVMHCRAPFAQPAAFLTRACVERAGGQAGAVGPGKFVSEGLHFALDQDLWCRARSSGAAFELCGDVLAMFSVGAGAKSSVGGWKITREAEAVYRAFAPVGDASLAWWYRRLRLPCQRAARSLGAPATKLWARTGDALIVAALGLRYGRRAVKALDWTWCV